MTTARTALRRWALTAAIARTGDEMAAPAVFLAVLGVTNSPRPAAWAVAAMTAATALAGPVVGARLDASPRPRRITALATLWMAGTLAGIGVLPSGDAAVVLALAACAGLAAPVVSGGWTAQLPTVVPRGRLPTATAWDAATYNLAGIVGPGLVGGIGWVLGERFGVLAAAAVLAVATPLALAVPRLYADPGGAGDAGTSHRPLHLLGEVWRGTQALVRNVDLRRVTVMTSLGYLGIGLAFVAAPLRGAEFLQPAAGGVLLACFAVGALLGTATSTRTSLRFRPDQAVLLGTVALGVFLVAAAVMPTFAATGAVLTLAGWADGLLFTGMLSVRHREAPPRFRAQIFTTAASLKIGAYAVGIAAAGAVTDDGGTLLLAAGVTQFVAAVAGTAVAGRRLRTSPADGRPSVSVPTSRRSAR